MSRHGHLLITFGLMAIAAVLVMVALDVTHAQPSAQRVLVTAVIAAVAPLFWTPGVKTPARSALAIVAWSCAAALFAALTLIVLRGTGASLGRVAAVCAMLVLIMVVTHAFAAALGRAIATRSADAQSAHELAGRTATFVLLLLGSLPLWLGAAAELASNADVPLIDAAIAVSPLMHLALASGNDLLRNQWFYQHSNLAALRYTYPAIVTVAAVYIALALALIVAPLGSRRDRPVGGKRSTSNGSTTAAPTRALMAGGNAELNT